jgi:hypothetical protein
MASENKVSGKEQTEAARPADESEESPRKRRRHGYRGYPLRKGAGGVHLGQGFSGVEPLGGGGLTLPHAGILTEESTRRTKS